jgi:hypothetical protein
MHVSYGMGVVQGMQISWNSFSNGLVDENIKELSSANNLTRL